MRGTTKYDKRGVKDQNRDAGFLAALPAVANMRGVLASSLCMVN